MTITHGVRANLWQFTLQLVQVFFVGLTLGMTRTVIPAVAETDFGLQRRDARLLAAFVIAFGIVKGVMNFVAGRWSERIGRRRVLLVGWIVALPIPFMIRFGPSWNWIVAATVLLGINQGLAWSMAITSKLDLTTRAQRGLANGLNEFAGYSAVAIAGVVTGALAERFGARQGLFVFGMIVIGLAGMVAMLWVRDTRAWAVEEGRAIGEGERAERPSPRPSPSGRGGRTSSTWDVFAMSWRDRRMLAICQAGMVEKFTDALIWLVYPVFLAKRGVSLTNIGWIVALYGGVWGVSQLFTGPLSDRVGRMKPIVAGMVTCGVGVGLMLAGDGIAWWCASAAISGLGMGLLYPNLGAAVSDLASPEVRGTALGVYRFWRDLGYSVGALMIGIAVAARGDSAAFVAVSASMVVSGAVMWVVGRETHPRLARG